MRIVSVLLLIMFMVGVPPLVAAQEQDVQMTVSIQNNIQQGPNYSDIPIEILLEYPSQGGDLKTVDINLSISDGAVFVVSDAFTLSAGARNASRTSERITPQSSRQFQITLRPQSNAAGVYALDVSLTVDGTLRPELTQRRLITLGSDLISSIQAGGNAGFNAIVADPPLIEADDTGTVMVLITNTTDSETDIVVDIQTFSALLLENENTEQRIQYPDLKAGELRVFAVEYSPRPDASPGRYSMRITSSNADESLNLVVPYGPYAFATPRAEDDDGVINGLFLHSVAIPAELSLSQSREGTMLIWVENVLSASDMRSLDVTLTDPTESIGMVPREGQVQPEDNLFTVAITSLRLGPNEGVLLEADFEARPTTVAGGYSLQIIAMPSAGGEQNSMWIPLQVTN